MIETQRCWAIPDEHRVSSIEKLDSALTLWITLIISFSAEPATKIADCSGVRNLLAGLLGTPNAIKSVWEGSHFATYCKMGPEPL